MRSSALEDFTLSWVIACSPRPPVSSFMPCASRQCQLICFCEIVYTIALYHGKAMSDGVLSPWEAFTGATKLSVALSIVMMAYRAAGMAWHVRAQTVIASSGSNLHCRTTSIVTSTLKWLGRKHVHWPRRNYPSRLQSFTFWSGPPSLTFSLAYSFLSKRKRSPSFVNAR